MQCSAGHINVMQLGTVSKSLKLIIVWSRIEGDEKLLSRIFNKSGWERKGKK